MDGRGRGKKKKEMSINRKVQVIAEEEGDKETRWFRRQLRSFRDIFMCLLFYFLFSDSFNPLKY